MFAPMETEGIELDLAIRPGLVRATAM
jgi:hypothetical protein